MIKTRLELYNKLSSIKNKKEKREFLLNCIKTHKKIITENYDIESSIKSTNIQFCKLCNSNDFIKDNYSETCQRCGFVRDLPATGRIYEKVKLIPVGTKKLPKELTTNVSKWLYDTDPLYKGVEDIKDKINIIFSSKGIVLKNNNIETTAISLWYNFNYLLKESNNVSFNKKPILALCIFYGASINNYNITLEQLSIIFDITITTIYKHNNILKDVFKNTNYIQYFNLVQQTNCDIKLSAKYKNIFIKIKKDLSYDKNITNEQYAGIVYYITNNKQFRAREDRKYTLSDLGTECNVSHPNISKISKSIENYYKQNPAKYKLLL